MAVSFDMFGLMRRKAKGRGVRTASTNTTSGLGLGPITFGVPSSPSADTAGATHQTPSPLVSAFPLPGPPTKITSISDIVFSNAAFDALLESRNAGDQ